MPEAFYNGCTTHPSSGPWKDARDRGVTFRATRNEPGWVLDIAGGGETALTSDYGEKRFRFATPEPEASGNRIVYTSRTRDIAVEIERGLCRDGKSGFPFQAAVDVRAEGKRH
jgi:putative lipoprotein